MDDDWFRNNRWGAEEQRFFFEKLNRASDYNRAQYVRIKALSLFETNKKKFVLASIELLNLMLEKYPDRSELAPCYLHLAEAYAFLGQKEKAVKFFEKCLDQEKELPSVKTSATLIFPEWIVKNKIQDRFEQALKVLERGFAEGFILPNQFFLYHGLKALIKNDFAEAEIALSFAAQKESGLIYHEVLGLVRKDHWLIKELKKINK